MKKFDVSCPSAKRNIHRQMFNRSADIELIELSISNGGVETIRLTVSDAEKLALELLDWVREIKNEEESA